MANPSFQIDQEKLDEFDEIILQKKARGEIDRDTSRSEVIRQLVEEYVEGNGNCSPAIQKPTPATSD